MKAYAINNELSLEEYKVNIFRLNMLLSTIVPTILLTTMAWFVNYDLKSLIVGASFILSHAFISYKVNSKNYLVITTYHFVVTFICALALSNLLPFIKYEFIVCLALIITVYACYPLNKKGLNVFFYSLFALAAVVTGIYENFFDNRFESTLASDNFNKIFFVFCIYTVVLQIYLAIKVQNKILLDSNSNFSRYQALFDNSADAILISSRKKKRIVSCNERAEELFNISKAEFLSPAFSNSSIMPEFQPNGKSSKSVSTNQVKLVRETGLSSQFDFTHLRDGVEFETETTIVLNSANPDITIVIIKDISDRKEAETKLNDRNELLNNLLNSSFDGIEIFSYDEEMNVVDYETNHQLSELFGRTPAELKVMNFKALSAEFQNGTALDDALINKLEFFKGKFKTNDQVEFEWSFKHKNGTPFDTRYSRYSFKKGTSKVVVSVFKDITEENRIKKELELNEAMYSHLFESAFDGMEILHKENGVKVGPSEKNEKYLELFDAAKEDLEIDDAIMKFAPELQANGEKSNERIIEISNEFRQNGKVNFDWRVRTKQGKIKDVNISCYDLKVTDTTSFTTVTVKDVSENVRQRQLIKSQLNALNTKNEQLEKYIESNMQLENFAYIASHDLQAPIRSIISFSQLLQKSLGDSITEEQKEYTKFVVDYSINMKRLIDDLLQFSRVNTKRANINLINPEELVGNLKHLLLSDFEKEQVELEIKDLPKYINGDEVKLNQLLQNLITNAVKFKSEDRPAKVEVGYVPNNNGHWHFYVKDNGMGIGEEYHDKIFMLFKRLNGNKPGTGLGLAICKKIIDQHDGKIWLESEEGEGTTFHFTIDKNLLGTN